MTQIFHYRIDDGIERTIEVETGLYVSAAAAIPAIQGIGEFPIKISIWVPSLVPEYGPYHYVIREAGGEVRKWISHEEAARLIKCGLGNHINLNDP